jgi:hypothetical protein
MSAETWLDDNSRYLAASLQWLRLRLQAMARQDGSTSAPAPAPSAKPGLFARLRGASGGALAPAPVEPAVPDDKATAQAAAAREAAADTDPPPALLLLARSLGLSAFERDVVLLCAAAELDLAIAGLCAAVPANAGRAYPTFALALQAIAEPGWDALSPHRPLRYLRLLEINQPGATPLTAAALRADERIVSFIKGLNEPDERLTGLLTPLETDAAHALAASQHATADALEAQLRTLAGWGTIPLVQLLGTDSGSKQAVAVQIAERLNRRLYRIGADALPPQRAELETLARLWQRESLLLPLAHL